jgi:hypothetical protein
VCQILPFITDYKIFKSHLFFSEGDEWGGMV